MTTKLTETQLRVLSLACQRPDRAVHPMPKNLASGAADRVLSLLLKRGLVEETGQEGWTALVATPAAEEALGLEPEQDGEAPAGEAKQEAYSAATVAKGWVGRTKAGKGLTAAHEPDAAHKPPSPTRRPARLPRTVAGAEAPAVQAGAGTMATTPAAEADQPPSAPSTRANTKQALLIAMLQRPEGCTIAEAMEATGWLSHTVRGALAGALKKRLGLEITSEKVEGRGRVYRVGPMTDTS